jgi:plasminogen
MTDAAGLSYTGTMNVTISGRPCQMWSSQEPHVHPFDDVSFFPDNTDSLDAVFNYCRNPMLDAASSSQTKPWCYTVYESMENEYCDVDYCKGKQPVHNSHCHEVAILKFWNWTGCCAQFNG